MKKTEIAGAVFFVTLLVLTSSVLAQSTDASFQQAVAEYQQSPTKDAADKVIKLAVNMNKLPPVPEEAREHFVKGSALFKEAKSQEDFAQVLAEFKQAIHLAPWWPEARYNWALAAEAAGKYASAIYELKRYLLFKLPDAEARAVQDKIYVLEAKQEKAAKESSPEAVAAQEQNKSNDWLKKLDGVKFVRNFDDWKFWFEIHGEHITFYHLHGTEPVFKGTSAIQGREFHMDVDGGLTGNINEDGSSLTLHLNDGREVVYPREG